MEVSAVSTSKNNNNNNNNNINTTSSINTNIDNININSNNNTQQLMGEDALQSNNNNNNHHHLSNTLHHHLFSHHHHHNLTNHHHHQHELHPLGTSSSPNKTANNTTLISPMALKHHNNNLPFSNATSATNTTTPTSIIAPLIDDTSAYDSHVFEFDVVELEVNETIKQLLDKVENSLIAANKEQSLQKATTASTTNATTTNVEPPQADRIAYQPSASTSSLPPPPSSEARNETLPSWREDKNMTSVATAPVTESQENSPEHDLVNKQIDSSYHPKSYESSPDEATCDLVIDSSLPSNEPQDNSNQLETSSSSMDVEPGTFIDSQNSCRLDDSQSTITASGQEETTNPVNTDVDMKEDPPMVADAQMSKQLQSDRAEEKNEITGGNTELLATKSDFAGDQPNSKSNEPALEPDEATKIQANKEVVKLFTVGEKNPIATNLPDDMRESPEEKAKEMVVLRNLEISPPPLPTADKEEKLDESNTSETNSTKQDNKRKRTTELKSPEEMNESNASNETGGRGKRQRTQTKLFQIGTTSPNEDLSISIASSTSSRKSTSKQSSKPKSNSSSRKRTKSNNSSTSILNLSTAQDNNQPASVDQPDVIYDKNDYLAVRNEEDSFFLCQLTENVRIKRPSFKVKWLDTKDNGKTYFLTSQYDRVPQQSIIMPVELDKVKSEKKGELFFSISDQTREVIMDRLKRSLNAQSECNSSQDLSGCSQSTT